MPYSPVAKRCPKCGKVLLAEMFYNNKTECCGLSPYCKKCENIRRKKYAKSKQSKKIETAINALNYAVSAGKVIRPNKCEVCSEPCTPEGHHEDYLLPFAVIWMCTKCHGKRGKELKLRRAL